MSVVIFLPLFLTKVSNTNCWATMKQKQKQRKSQPQKKKPKLLVHLVNNKVLWVFSKSIIQK